MMVKINGTSCSYDVIDGMHIITSDDVKGLFAGSGSYDESVEEAKRQMEILLSKNR